MHAGNGAIPIASRSGAMRSMKANRGLQGPASAVTAQHIYAAKEKQMQAAAAASREASTTDRRLMHGPDIHAVPWW